jgi:hypothetical protein
VSPTPVPLSPTPTHTPTDILRQGDVDCDGQVNEPDFMLLLEFIAELTEGQQSAPCPDVNEPEPITGFGWGDVNCDEAIDALDALFIALFKAGVETPEPADPSCFAMGNVLT